ncbi:MAG: AAA family ATPase [Phycisphaerae bacterium]|nr:AAA family ATPase [Phycisphaerae bacterium]
MTQKALLLIGPTGAGKTPLGEYLQHHGLWDFPCMHFDFGAELRRIAAATEPPPPLDAADVDVIRSVLASGALLEDSQFPIAAGVLRRFLAEHVAAESGWVVLNGLPRHAGQARDVQPLVRVEMVIHLKCSPETMVQRISTNVGNDRHGRTDDDLASVRRRMESFRLRTEPLLQYYRDEGIPIETVNVGPATTPEDMCRQLLRTC